jgi:hypothetical protein
VVAGAEVEGITGIIGTSVVGAHVQLGTVAFEGGIGGRVGATVVVAAAVVVAA